MLKIMLLRYTGRCLSQSLYALCVGQVQYEMTYSPPSIVVRPNPYYYFIRTKLNDNVLTIEGGRTGSDRSPVVVSPRTSPLPLKIGDRSCDCQLWHLEDAGDGFVYIISKTDPHGRQVLDIKGASTSKCANLITYHRKYESEGKVANQKFKIREDGSISSALNNMVLDVKGNSMCAGAHVIMYPQKAGGAANQLWCFEPAHAARHHHQQHYPQQYIPSPGAYAPSTGMYPPQPGTYPSQPGGAYPPQFGGAYPPQLGAYPPQPGAYPPQPQAGVSVHVHHRQLRLGQLPVAMMLVMQLELYVFVCLLICLVCMFAMYPPYSPIWPPQAGVNVHIHNGQL